MRFRAGRPPDAHSCRRRCLRSRRPSAPGPRLPSRLHPRDRGGPGRRMALRRAASPTRRRTSHKSAATSAARGLVGADLEPVAGWARRARSLPSIQPLADGRWTEGITRISVAVGTAARISARGRRRSAAPAQEGRPVGVAHDVGEQPSRPRVGSESGCWRQPALQPAAGLAAQVLGVDARAAAAGEARRAEAQAQEHACPLVEGQHGELVVVAVLVGQPAGVSRAMAWSSCWSARSVQRRTT